MVSQQQVDDLLPRLANVPRRMADVVERLSAAETPLPMAEGTWSAMEILAHVRASDDIIAYRLYTILARDNPSLPAYDDRRWAEVTGYAGADVALSLQTYTLRRAELVHMLRQVPLQDWQRSGTHEVKGLVSLWDVATHLVDHEEEHCLQLETTYQRR